MEQTFEVAYFSADCQVQRALLQERKLFLWGQIDDALARRVTGEILYLEAMQSGMPIHMFVNSPGGMVTAGYAIYDLMQVISSPVYTYCMGFAASMGSVLLSGGEKGHRYIYPMAEVMIHQPSVGGFQATSADIEINARQIIKTKDRTAAILAANCGQTKEKILQDFDRDYWMDASEALAYGIVDKLAGA